MLSKCFIFHANSYGVPKKDISILVWHSNESSTKKDSLKSLFVRIKNKLEDHKVRFILMEFSNRTLPFYIAKTVVLKKMVRMLDNEKHARVIFPFLAQISNSFLVIKQPACVAFP